jgi:long-chain acyl-CoA synthetase
MRPHLATLVEDFHAHRRQTAVVLHRGVRSYRTTYGDLAHLAGRFAADLDRRGIAPSERVILWGENSAEWIAAFFGCLLRGVLAVPLDAAGSVSFANRVIADVTPSLIVGDTSLLATLPTGIDRLPFPEMVAHLPAEPDFRVSEAVREDAPFQIVFTSGTTAEPKGVVHTHRNVLASLRPIEAEIATYLRYERLFHPIRFLHTLPLSHVFGQFMGLWLPAALAAELHFTDALEPARAVELIRRERVSVLVAVPRIVDLLRGHLLRRFPSLAVQLDQASGLTVLKRWWRFRAVHRALGFKFWAVISGGASLPPQLERFWNTLGFALIQGYGMTETAALVTLNHPFKVGKGNIGKVLPGREVRLSETGEMLVRGDMISGTAWRNGRMEPRTGEWLATGDLAKRDDAGELRFLGRLGDAIVTSAGLNIYPSDLEAALKRQPGVRDCVVIPCEFATGIEPVAVVLFSGDDAALPQLVSAANAGLAEYQHIRRVLRWPRLDLPYGSTGKLLRREVKDWACSALLQQSTASPSTAENLSDPLLSLIAEVTGEPAPKPDDSLRLFEDLHLDSLGRVQLGSALEQRVGVDLEDDQLAAIKTLGDLRALLAKSYPAASTAASPVPSPHAPAPEHPRSVSLNTAVPHPTPAVPADQPPYPRWPWSFPVRALRIAFLEAIARPLTWFLAAPRVVAPAQELPPGPLLLIANHVTAFDGALVIYALPAHLRRRVAIAMSGEMLMDYRRARGQPTRLQNLLAPAAYWLLTALFNVFPLPRIQGFRRSFAHAGQAMDRGYSVLIFPEGTRSRDGHLHSFRQGIGLLAAQSRVPVLPVALIGLGELRAAQRWFRSGRLEVRIGEPVAMPEQTTPEEWKTALESVIRRLTGDA